MNTKSPAPQGETESKITCEIRCMDPAAVEEAMGRLDPDGTVRVPYTCRISGKKEEILLLGKHLAARLAEAMPETGDAAGARILAGLTSSELCECDVATLSGLPENEVVDRLEAFTARGLLAHRKLHGMHYFRLCSEHARCRIEAFTRDCT